MLGKLFGSGAAKSKPRGPRVNIEKRFRLHNRIGQGSMSKVWRATDTTNGRTVCLKVLDKEKLEQLLKRFIGKTRPDEGEIAVSLDHPHIVRTYEHGVTNRGEQFLVMEFIEGMGLNFLIETKAKQFVDHELDFLIQAGEGLAYFHEKGYIHRDICPRNMLVTHEGVLKLIDFGLAVPNTPEFRKPGNRTGTANYMAPELIRRYPTDPRIDIFSFAASAYEAFTGDLPWESAESLQTMLQHLNNPPRDPCELRAGLDRRIADVILKGLERDPNDRYQTMKEFVAALRRVKDEVVA